MSQPPVALIIGASRGIGKQIALTLSSAGYAVAIAAKTLNNTDKIPGSIQEVAEEIRAKKNNGVLPIKCDVRNVQEIENMVNTVINTWGRIDYLIYNSGAIWWETIKNTPLKRFDLLHEVNIRGCYAAIQFVLPHMEKQNFGRLLIVSPPIYSRFIKGKAAYAIGKLGMTVLVMGLAEELKNTNITVSAIWPASAVESFVTTKQNVPASFLRKATIFSDAVLMIGQEKDIENIHGKALVDEDYLRSKGITDFTQYRCNPNEEPPRMLPKKFPSLKVEEENENLFNFRSKL